MRGESIPIPGPSAYMDLTLPASRRRQYSASSMGASHTFFKVRLAYLRRASVSGLSYFFWPWT